MPSVNRVFLIGNLTRDPELRYIPSGTAVASFGLAMNRKYKAQDGELKEEVCFVDIDAWGRTAETCAEYLSKGSLVCIEGSLKYDTWEAQDGQKRSKLKVRTDRVHFLGGRRDEGAPGAGSARPAGSADEAKADDDIPF